MSPDHPQEEGGNPPPSFAERYEDPPSFAERGEGEKLFIKVFPPSPSTYGGGTPGEGGLKRGIRVTFFLKEPPGWLPLSL